MVFKIEEDGWPSLECHDESEALGVGEAKREMEVFDSTGHSYNSSLVRL